MPLGEPVVSAGRLHFEHANNEEAREQFRYLHRDVPAQRTARTCDPVVRWAGLGQADGGIPPLSDSVWLMPPVLIS